MSNNPNDNEYTLPNELSVALLTNRMQFVQLYQNRVDAGHMPTADELREILRLMADLLEDRQTLTKEMVGLGQAVSQAQRQMAATSRRMRKMEDGLIRGRGVFTEPDIDMDEEAFDREERRRAGGASRR